MQHFSITKIKWLILIMEIVPVYIDVVVIGGLVVIALVSLVSNGKHANPYTTEATGMVLSQS
jgi:hypothetical protein